MTIKLDKSKLTRSLGQRYKLVPHLERAIEKGDFEWTFEYAPKLEDDAWHPSSHCTPPLSELYYAAIDPPEKGFSAALYKTFQVGHFWHGYLQHIVALKLEFCDVEAIERRGSRGWGFLKDGSDPGPDAEWEPFHWVTGSADIAPCSIPSHGDFLVDFKTMGSHDFRRNGPPDWCADKWECQLNIYMDFFDLERALIFGILKDSPHDFKEFEYKRNQPLVDALYQKWQLVSSCLDEGVSPPEDEVFDLPLKGALPR